MRKLLTIGFLALLSSLVQAATYYVDAARPDDSGAGTSWATSEKTITAGVAHLSSGDTLKIKTGTYAETVNVTNKYFSSTTRIETDDGAGNPGIVTITGSATCVDVNVVVCMANAGILTFDGRQSEIEGNASYGFILSPSATANGIRVNEYSTNNAIKILRTKVIGTKLGSDFGSFHVGYAGNAEVAYNKIAQTGGNTGDCIIVFSAGEVGGPNTTGGSIHHNDVSCNPSSGYGAITQKRTNGVNVYNNNIHDIGNNGVGIILRDQSMVGTVGSEVYNNTITNNTAMWTGIQVRGFSTGTGGTDNAKIYQNTIYANSNFPYGAFFLNDPSDGNLFYNNLVVGSASTYWDSWAQYQGRNNQYYNNYVTGSVTTWMPSGMSVMFSVTSPNYANVPLGSVPADVGVQSGGATAPVLSAVTCSPTSIQAVGTTTCSATLSGGTPTTYTWTTTSTGTQCQPSGTNPATYTCQYGGTYQPCLTVSNSGGSSGPVCAATSLSVRYRQPTGLGSN